VDKSAQALTSITKTVNKIPRRKTNLFLTLSLFSFDFISKTSKDIFNNYYRIFWRVIERKGLRKEEAKEAKSNKIFFNKNKKKQHKGFLCKFNNNNIFLLKLKS
jgi:hypothetical protein